jgi:hypothetical protein
MILPNCNSLRRDVCRRIRAGFEPDFISSRISSGNLLNFGKLTKVGEAFLRHLVSEWWLGSYCSFSGMVTKVEERASVRPPYHNFFIISTSFRL